MKIISSGTSFYIKALLKVRAGNNRNQSGYLKLRILYVWKMISVRVKVSGTANFETSCPGSVGVDIYNKAGTE